MSPWYIWSMVSLYVRVRVCRECVLEAGKTHHPLENLLVYVAHDCTGEGEGGEPDFQDRET